MVDSFALFESRYQILIWWFLESNGTGRMKMLVPYKPVLEIFVLLDGIPAADNQKDPFGMGFCEKPTHAGQESRTKSSAGNVGLFF